MGKKWVRGIFDPAGWLQEAIFGSGSFLNIFSDAVWGVVRKHIVEPVLEAFGITDELIQRSEVFVTKVFGDDLLYKTRIRLILDYVENKRDAKDMVLGFGHTGAAQFLSFYNNGKSNFEDYLPDATLITVSMPTSAIQRALEGMHPGKVIIVQDTNYSTLNDDDIAKYNLQEAYGYDPINNICLVNGTYYEFWGSERYDSDRVVIANMIPVSVNITETLITETTVSNHDLIYDNQYVKVTKQTVITKLKSEVDPETGDTYNRNIKLQTKYEIISETNTLIPNNTGSNSYVSVEISNVDIITDPNDFSKIITNYSPQNQFENYNHYTVFYSIGDINNGLIETNRIWLYDPIDMTYPDIIMMEGEALKPSIKLNFETYPVVMFRNGFFNVTDYDKKEVDIDGKKLARPPSITEKRYKETKEMFRTIGLDLQDIIDNVMENPDANKVMDSFIQLAVCPTNYIPIVSKTLFETFEYLYSQVPVTQAGKGEGTYSMCLKETPFNLNLTWTAEKDEIISGKIGYKGSYTHEINTLSKEISETVSDGDGGEVTRFYTAYFYQLVLKKQITENTIKIIRITDLKSLALVKQGSYIGATELDIADPKFLFPFPVVVAGNMSFMELTELLGASVHLVFYSYNEKFLKYYDTAKFAYFVAALAQIMMFVVTVVLTIVTGPGGAATGAVISKIMAGLLIGLALSIALKIIMGVVKDPYLRVIFTVVATAIAAYAGGGGNLDSIMPMLASNLVQLPVMAMDMYLADKNAALQKEASKFEKKYQTRLDTMESANAMLNIGIDVSDLAVISTDVGMELTSASSLSPSMLRYLQTNAFLNLDLLYTNNISNYCSSQLQIGVLE